MAFVNVKCQKCGKDYQASELALDVCLPFTFCSDKCAKDAQAEESRSQRAGFHKLNCQKCGGEFHSSVPFNPSLAHHLYCSDPCEAAARGEAAEELAKLRAFKAYTHKRLDEIGIASDPESPHKAEGCRIGGRLDEVERLLIAARLAYWHLDTYGQLPNHPDTALVESQRAVFDALRPFCPPIPGRL